jgi:hypothetical protein
MSDKTTTIQNLKAIGFSLSQAEDLEKYAVLRASSLLLAGGKRIILSVELDSETAKQRDIIVQEAKKSWNEGLDFDVLEKGVKRGTLSK